MGERKGIMKDVIIQLHGETKTGQLVFMYKFLRDKNPDWIVTLDMETMSFVMKYKIKGLG